MKEYIEREAVMLEITEWHEMYPDSDAAREALSMVKQDIKAIPAADVRPVVRGKWEKSYADHEAFGVRPFFRYCSVCNEATVYPYNYCPNCGAEMRGKENG